VNLNLAELTHWVELANSTLPPDDLAKKIFALTDLTLLNETATLADIVALCDRATNHLGHAAAICIYPEFIQNAKSYLSNETIKIATVANFPQGTAPLNQVISSIQLAIELGAQELDVVFPYQDFLDGNSQHLFIEACKTACGKLPLKVILETGVIQDPNLITKAVAEVLQAGADFVKTSTGKLTPGATLEAAASMLLTIRALTPILNRPIGIKISGGVRSYAQAGQYLALAEAIMKKNWAMPNTFRIGTSGFT
jgi:deoxyribose-phosphate aldolase